ncbi:MAG: hypothetical protein JXR49_17630 [Acidobacteria bacterium]|nr:hypothetical protein [Acidobacteriota bacterium]
MISEGQQSRNLVRAGIPERVEMKMIRSLVKLLKSMPEGENRDWLLDEISKLSR